MFVIKVIAHNSIILPCSGLAFSTLTFFIIVFSHQFVGRVSARLIINMKHLAIIERSVKPVQISFLINGFHLNEKILSYLYILNFLCYVRQYSKLNIL